MSHQLAKLPALSDGLARVESVLLCIFVAVWGSRSWRTAMHATAFFALDGRRSAGLARAGLCAASLAGKHRTSIACMIARHFFFESLFAVTGAAFLLSITGIGNVLS